MTFFLGVGKTAFYQEAVDALCWSSGRLEIFVRARRNLLTLGGCARTSSLSWPYSGRIDEGATYVNNGTRNKVDETVPSTYKTSIWTRKMYTLFRVRVCGTYNAPDDIIRRTLCYYTSSQTPLEFLPGRRDERIFRMQMSANRKTWKVVQSSRRRAS